MRFTMTRGRWMDLAWVLFLVVLWFTGGFTWLQSQLLRVVARAPKTVEAAAVTPIADATWDWRLRDLDGNFHSLREFQGKPLFVNRWATWCGPCLAEMPSIKRLHEAYGDRIAVVLVSDENPDVLLAWLGRNGYADLPVYRATELAPEAFASSSIPASWLLDPDGRVVAEHRGAARWDAGSIRESIDVMLAKSKNQEGS